MKDDSEDIRYTSRGTRGCEEHDPYSRSVNFENLEVHLEDCQLRKVQAQGISDADDKSKLFQYVSKS